MVEADGGTFLGVNGVVQKELPYRVANITSHNQTPTNHTKILTKFHSWVEMSVSLKGYYILNILHEVQLHEEVEAGNVMYPWDWIHIQIVPPNREVPTLMPSIYFMKSKGE